MSDRKTKANEWVLEVFAEWKKEWTCETRIEFPELASLSDERLYEFYVKVRKVRNAWDDEQEDDDKQKCYECGEDQENLTLDLCNACDEVMSRCFGDDHDHECEYFARDKMWRAGKYHYCSRKCVQEYLDKCRRRSKHPEPVHRPKIGDEDDEDCDDFRRFLAIIHPADE